MHRAGELRMSEIDRALDAYRRQADAFRWELPDGFNFGRDVIDRRAREADGPALLWRGAGGAERRLRYSDVARASNRMARLARSLGVRPGDPVLVMLPRVPEWQQAMVGLLKAGALVIPSSTLLRPKDIVYRAQHSGAVAVIAGPESTAAVDAAHLIDRLERLARSGAPVKGLNPAQWQALRYLARANRFSRTPAALADYLGSTRGTVSQTLIALEEKGFVARAASGRDRRSVELALTAKGAAALAEDPLLTLADDIAAATGGRAEALAEALRAVLRAAVARNGGRAFGVCRTCRHFKAGHLGAPHLCTLLDEPLGEEDIRAICLEQEDV